MVSSSVDLLPHLTSCLSRMALPADANISQIMATIIHNFDDNINPRCYKEELPEELWIGIFIRLSAKSLMQVICVCKHWYYVINDPSFTRRHLQFQKRLSKNSGHFLLRQNYQHIPLLLNYYLFDGKQEVVEDPHAWVPGGPPPRMSPQVSSAMTSSLWLSYQNFPLNFRKKWHDGSLEIDGPIHGLYCLHNQIYHFLEGRFVIWNPATNEVGFLPFSEQCLPADYYDKYRCSLHVTGFGKDPLDEEDYKVIIISSYRRAYTDDTCTYGMLYTTKTNTWRLLNDDLVVAHSRVDPSNSTYLNGFYYWMGKRECTALVFDMGKKEVFLEISTPCHGTMAAHNDHITLFSLNKSQNEIDIWVMLEESNWLKKNSIGGIQGRVMKPLGFWKMENEILLVTDYVDDSYYNYPQTVLYNTTTREIKAVGPRGHDYYFKAFDYYESLVSLSGGITKYKGNDHASLWDTVRSFLQEDPTSDYRFR